MRILLGVLPSLVGLVIIVALVIAVVSLVRRRANGGASHDEDPGIGTLRRLYFYGLSLAGLVAGSLGLIFLLSAALDALFGPRVISGREATLARGLALAIVGTPIWLVFWGMAQRSVRQFPAEATTLGRKFYLYLVLAAAALTSASAGVNFLSWALRPDGFDGTPTAVFVVWAAVWWLHWMVERQDGAPLEAGLFVRRLYIYGISFFGLLLVAFGLWGVLTTMLGSAYETLVGAPRMLLEGPGLWSESTRTGLAMAMVGGVVWAWHWHRLAAREPVSPMRSVYLYLFAVLGGAATVVVSASVLLYRVLQWFLGSPESTSARVHFDFVPATIAGFIIGGGLWGYHWSVARAEAGEAGAETVAARRVYSYLVAAVGLVTLGVGLSILFAVAFGVLSPERPALTRTDWWRNPLTLAITLIAVGVPLWGLYWRDAQRLAVERGAEERRALSRRLFIYLIFFGSVILTLVNLSIALFKVFDAALGEGIGPDLLWDVRWNLAILLTAGAVSVYYWLVLGEDRREAPAPAPAVVGRRKRVTVLAPAGDEAALHGLEERLGYQVQLWRTLEARPARPALSGEALAEAARSIAEAPSDNVLLLVEDGGIRVVPYHPEL